MEVYFARRKCRARGELCRVWTCDGKGIGIDKGRNSDQGTVVSDQERVFARGFEEWDGLESRETIELPTLRKQRLQGNLVSGAGVKA
jgi:hypothetical protein